MHCDGAIQSFEDATKGLAAKKRNLLVSQIEMQIWRLANGEHISKAHFPSEALLPRYKNKKRRNFRAFKKIPIRGYCWKSDTHADTYFISHYIHKKQDPLSSKDTERVHNNWRDIEEHGDENGNGNGS